MIISTGRELLGCHCRGSSGCQVYTGLCCLLIFATLCLSVSGCSKKSKPAIKSSNAAAAIQDAAASTDSNPATNPKSTLPTAATLQPGSVAAPPAPAVDVPSLQREVVKWIVRNRRTPKNFEDFAATAGTQIPPPPAGKKYSLTPQMHVQVIDQ